MSSLGCHSLPSILPTIPSKIVNALENEFADMESRFARRDWGPAELDGGRFAEAALRYLEWRESGGSFTPIGKQINRKKVLNEVSNNATLPDGLRFHVAKCTEVLVDIRNKRDVAHLGPDISVDEMNAHLVMRLAAWILAEIIREESGLPPQDIQDIIARLSSRRIPLVEEVGGDLVVVATHLRAKQRALVALYHSHPKPINIQILRKAVGYQNKARFRRIISELAKEGITHLKDEDVYLTNKGVSWVEKNIEMQLEV